MSHFLSDEGWGRRKDQTNTNLQFIFCFSKKEDPLRLECWLREEQLGKSNCVDGAVFRGVIKGCATCSGAVVGSAILGGTILGGTMIGCAIVSIAIAGGAIESSTIRGSARLHYFLVHHCRQCYHRQRNRWVRAIDGCMQLWVVQYQERDH